MSSSFFSELFVCVCVCVYLCVHAHRHRHAHMCSCQNECVNSLNWADWGMEEWTLKTWKRLCKVQRSWGSRNTDALEKSPGMSLTEQAVHVNRHVSVNTYQKGEAGERHLGAVTEDAKEQRQRGPDSQAQKRGYTRPKTPGYKGFSVLKWRSILSATWPATWTQLALFCKVWGTDDSVA